MTTQNAYISHTSYFRAQILSAFLLFCGYGLFLNSAGVKLAQMGVSNINIGALNAAYFGGAIVSGLASHRMLSRVGHIRSFCIFGGLFAVASLAHTMWDNLWAWGVFRFVLGFCYYSMVMIVESWFSEKIIPEKKSKLLSQYNIVYYVAFTLGAWLLSLQLGGEKIFALSAIMVMLSMLPIGLTLTTEPKLPALQNISLPKVWEIVPLATVGSFIGGLMVNGFFTMASVYLLRQGLSVTDVSYYVTSTMVGGFLVQVPAAKISDKWGRRFALILMTSIAMVGVALGLLAQFLPHQWFWLQYISAFLFGFGALTIYPLCLARASDVLSQAGNRLTPVGISRSILFCWGLGSFLGPLLLGGAMAVDGQMGFGAVLLTGSVLLILFAFRQPSVPKAFRQRYISALPTEGGSLAGVWEDEANAASAESEQTSEKAVSNPDADKSSTPNPPG